MFAHPCSRLPARIFAIDLVGDYCCRSEQFAWGVDQKADIKRIMRFFVTNVRIVREGSPEEENSIDAAKKRCKINRADGWIVGGWLRHRFYCCAIDAMQRGGGGTAKLHGGPRQVALFRLIESSYPISRIDRRERARWDDSGMKASKLSSRPWVFSKDSPFERLFRTIYLDADIN